MRNLRSIGIAVLAMFALGALGGAASASAAIGGPNEAKFFAQCPLSLPQIVQCDYAKSGPGSEFQAGKIAVPLTRPEVLQGGISQNEDGTTVFWGAESGNKTTLVPVAQEVPGGLESNIDVSKLSGSALAAYEKAVAAGKTKVTATIELAGPPHPAVSLEFDCFLSGTCPAISLPVQVKLRNSFLGRNCSIGTNNSPIQIELITGTTSPPPPNEPITGALGELAIGGEGSVAVIKNNSLVNNSYAAPGATGCGTPLTESQVDAAINSATGLPSPAGTNKAIIKGTLRIAAATYVKEHFRG
jgi:hypothetical protein